MPTDTIVTPDPKGVTVQFGDNPNVMTAAPRVEIQQDKEFRITIVSPLFERIIVTFKPGNNTQGLPIDPPPELIAKRGEVKPAAVTGLPDIYEFDCRVDFADGRKDQRWPPNGKGGGEVDVKPRGR